MLFFISIYFFGIIGFLIHLYRTPLRERTTARILELFLLYQLVFSVGISSLVAFLGLTFMGKYVADITNWPWCPFEQQLANVNLAFGTLGILCIKYRGLFWLATVVGFSIWIFSDGIHHIVDYLVKGNASEGNVGVPLITDLLIPTILVVLVVFYEKYRKKGRYEF